MMLTILPSPKLLCATVGLLLGLLPVTWAQNTAAYTTLHSFAGTDGANPGNLVEGNDGNFYGTTADGAFNYNAEEGGSGYGTVFQITPAGVLTTIYVFAGDSDGQHPGGLIKSIDGNFYGQTRNVSITGDSATVFRITPAGELTTIYATDDVFELGPLVQNSDGNFYGVTGGGENGTIFRLTPAGVYTTLYTFTGDDGTAGSSLTRGSDGNFYGTTIGGAENGGTIYQITPAGAFKTLYTFTGDADGFLANGLTLASDGNLYGTTSYGGTKFYGAVFRITNAGQFSLIYSFTGGSDSGFPSNLVAGLDGNLYGTTFGDTLPTVEPGVVADPPIVVPPIEPNPPAVPPGLPSVFFQITTQGVLTPLYASAHTIGGFDGGTDEVVQGSDGSFYGTSTGYEDSDGSSSQGAVYKLTVESHPAFFTGQAPLIDGVDYLAFPNGNVFGYYTFLSDPNYLYHFDLGYEYLFDAKDSQGGIYLYDFASSDFFYTSPTFPFPYLYDFNLKTVLYYYPDPNNPGHYNTNGVRYFYDFATGHTITK